MLARDAKAGQRALIPLRVDLVKDLRDWLHERLGALRDTAKEKGTPLPLKVPVDDTLFSVPRNLIKSFNRDLAAAGIPKEDERGRTVDLHALRHTFGTHLSKNGVAPRTAQAALQNSCSASGRGQTATAGPLQNVRCPQPAVRVPKRPLLRPPAPACKGPSCP